MLVVTFNIYYIVTARDRLNEKPNSYNELTSENPLLTVGRCLKTFILDGGIIEII